MNLTEEQIHKKLSHRGTILQVFEQDKNLIIQGHDTVVDMYRVTLRVWRKLRSVREQNTQASKHHSLSQEDEAMAWYDKA